MIAMAIAPTTTARKSGVDKKRCEAICLQENLTSGSRHRAMQRQQGRTRCNHWRVQTVL